MYTVKWLQTSPPQVCPIRPSLLLGRCTLFCVRASEQRKQCESQP